MKKEVPLPEVDQEKKAHDYNITKSTEFISSEIKKQGDNSFEDGTNEVVSETTLPASSPSKSHEALLELSIESGLEDPTFKNLCPYKKKKKIASQVTIYNDGSMKMNFPLMLSSDTKLFKSTLGLQKRRTTSTASRRRGNDNWKVTYGKENEASEEEKCLIPDDSVFQPGHLNMKMFANQLWRRAMTLLIVLNMTI